MELKKEEMYLIILSIRRFEKNQRKAFATNFYPIYFKENIKVKIIFST